MRRFVLEQSILSCWNVIDEIKVVRTAIADDLLTKDQMENVLLGLEELYSLKFQHAYRTLEEYQTFGEDNDAS